MKEHAPVSVVITDATRARLLRCQVVPPGRLHVEENDDLETTEKGYEHTRPSPRMGRTGNAPTHEPEEKMHRFALQLGDWLQSKFRRTDVGRVVLFAPPRFLGILRQTILRRFNDHVEAREAELMHLDRSRLAHHPAIRQLVAI